MSHNCIGKQSGYDGTNVEFIAKNLVCETLNGTAVPSGGLSQTLDEVCTGPNNNITSRQVIANGLVTSNGRVFVQQPPLVVTNSQLSGICTVQNGEIKTQTLTKEVVLPNGLQSVCDIQNNTTTAIVGNGLQSTTNISAATTVQAGTQLLVTTKPTTIPSVANQEVLVWDNNVIKAINLDSSVTSNLQTVTTAGNSTTNDIIIFKTDGSPAVVGANSVNNTLPNGQLGNSFFFLEADTDQARNKTIFRFQVNDFPVTTDEPTLPLGTLYVDINGFIKMKTS